MQEEFPEMDRINSIRERFTKGEDISPEERELLGLYRAYVFEREFPGRSPELKYQLVGLRLYLERAKALVELIKQEGGRPLVEYWAASVFVVAEGFKEKLNLSDGVVDDLLKSEHYETLRRFRNAVFHYQKDILSPKLTGLLTWECILWTATLYKELRRYIEAQCSGAITTVGEYVDLLISTTPSIPPRDIREAVAQTLGLGLTEFEQGYEQLKGKTYRLDFDDPVISRIFDKHVGGSGEPDEMLRRAMDLVNGIVRARPKTSPDHGRGRSGGASGRT